MDCPLGRGFAEECPAERTRRSAPPRPVGRALAARCVEDADWGFPTQDFRPTSIRFLFDAGPAERTRRSAPPPPVGWALAARGVEGADWGLRCRGLVARGAVFVRSRSSGADTEVRPPATRGLGPLDAVCGGRGLGVSMQVVGRSRGSGLVDSVTSRLFRRQDPQAPSTGDPHLVFGLLP